MIELQSEPSAIPPPPMANGLPCNPSRKKHLEWIYPLVVQAVQVAGKERGAGEVLQTLSEVLRVVGTA
jgi:hypothetical protein